MKSSLFSSYKRNCSNLRQIELDLTIYKWFTDTIDLSLNVIQGFLDFFICKPLLNKYKYLALLFLFFTTSNGVAQERIAYFPKNAISPGIHVQYSGRYGLIDLVYQRVIITKEKTSFTSQIGGGFLTTLDSYARTSHLIQGGIGTIYKIKENREIEINGIVSISEEFKFAPSIYSALNLVSKNKKHKVQFLLEANFIGDLDHSSKYPVTMRQEQVPIKIYVGFGARIARCF